MQYGAHGHKTPSEVHAVEYAKLAAVLVVVAGLAWMHADNRGMSLMQYFESFMGVFFIIFAGFKIVNLKEFAYGLKSYVGYQDKPLWVGYSYPFIQIALGLPYIFGYGSRLLDGFVFVWSAYGSYVVWKTLRTKGDFHCVCLGNVIKLPLSTTSFVEDFGMTVMALVMLILR